MKNGIPSSHWNYRHGYNLKRDRKPVYRSWESMICRCTNPTHPQYASYGGRGITVCKRWRNFINFLSDMGDRPAGRTLDRIDNNKGYFPGNCRWATPLQQRLNQRPYKRGKNRKGWVYYPKKGFYRARININKKRIHLGQFKTAEEAHAAYLRAWAELEASRCAKS
jgi:hypothetical protein